MTDPWRLHWKDYYKILQVIPSAETEVVEGAYRRLAAKYHPDKGRGDIRRMMLLNESYDVLRDAETRARYDADWRLRQDRRAQATDETDDTKPRAQEVHPEEAIRRAQENWRRRAEEASPGEQKAPAHDRAETAPAWMGKLETILVTSVLIGFPLIILVWYLASWAAPGRPKSAGAMEDRQPELAPLVAAPHETKAEMPPQAYLGQPTMPEADTAPEAAPRVQTGAEYPTSILSDTGIEMVYIGPGSFLMGSPTGSGDEKPVHTVRITRPFWMSRYEVTQSQYEAVTAINPSHFQGTSDLPVERASWNDAADFCRRLTERERWQGHLPAGYVYRLPTEAEWEYAARGGDQGRGFAYAGSNTPEEVAWHEGNSDRKTHPVGRKSPNELGLYDMSGNVWEWCHDWYGADYYGQSPAADATGPSAGSARVVRGGSWCRSPTGCRAYARDGLAPDLRYDACGFRAVLAWPFD
jgi:sulfatase modifying factor 1